MRPEDLEDMIGLLLEGRKYEGNKIVSVEPFENTDRIITNLILIHFTHYLRSSYIVIFSVYRWQTRYSSCGSCGGTG